MYDNNNNNCNDSIQKFVESVEHAAAQLESFAAEEKATTTAFGTKDDDDQSILSEIRCLSANQQTLRLELERVDMLLLFLDDEDDNDSIHSDMTHQEEETEFQSSDCLFSHDSFSGNSKLVSDALSLASSTTCATLISTTTASSVIDDDEECSWETMETSSSCFKQQTQYPHQKPAQRRVEKIARFLFGQQQQEQEGAFSDDRTKVAISAAVLAILHMLS